MALSDIIDVQISRETETVDRVSFGIPLFVAEGAQFVEKVRTYSNMDAVAEDFDSTDALYKMAQAAFSQEVRPRQIKLGLKVPEDTWTETLDAIAEYDSGWYALATESIDAADIAEIAAWIQARDKLYVARTTDADIITGAADDLASDLDGGEMFRTMLVYHTLAASQYIDAAILGNTLVRDPGSQTWAFKQLVTITPDKLSASARNYLKTKGANYYVSEAGIPIVLPGQVAGGEWTDIIRGTDWLKVRMQERIFTALANNPKIPYTNKGIAVIEAMIRAQLEQGVSVGLIADDTAHTVTVPDITETDPTDRQQRILRDVNFVARLAGAIHFIEVRGTVSA